ncbi:N-acyl-D-glutamate amidohydrolase [Sphingobacteriales bacterium UPWRP_1]|nr:N-acyl-D-glutamate amidohydrolase [Sphingobacteriales bacterium TSM_CSM]PSJ76363.1 N-acyl-D-glutamate amidohydrolase [Sphingobacteriales bacterium UPWRP_1]
MQRYLLKNGTVFDGSGTNGQVADVLVENGKIAGIGSSPMPPPHDCTVLDVSGKWVMPGFIDIHTHYDGEIEIDASLSESVRHGVTTVFLGSCGISMVMGPPENLSDMFTRVEGIPSTFVKPLLQRIKDWNSPEEYLQHLGKLPLGPNVACFLGHSTIRAAVMGLGRSLSSNVQPTNDELQQMNAILQEALQAGYMGLSVNLLQFDKMDGSEFRSRPTPSVYANWKEYRYLFNTLRQRGRILQTIPNTANPLTFFSFILESTGIRRQALKTSMLAMIDGKTVRGIHRIFGNSARLANRFLGAKVKFQGLPEEFDVWTDGLEAPFFEEFEAGTNYLHLINPDERSQLLLQPKFRQLFRKQWNRRIAPRVFHRNLKDTHIVSCPDDRLVGKSFAQVAAAEGKDVVDSFLDLLAKYGKSLRWYSVVGNDRPNELNWIVQHPDVQIGFSDAGAHLRNMAHYNFGLRLLKLVADNQAAGIETLTIGQAVKRITAELADWFMIDAGHLLPGKRADIAIVDPNHLTDEVCAIHEAPMPGLPEFKRLVRRNDAAVPYVFVNGQLACINGIMQPGYPNKPNSGGQVLRVSA